MLLSLALAFILLGRTHLEAAEPKPLENFQKLTSYDLEQGIKLAQDNKKYVLMYFWADWCSNCSDFQSKVLTEPRVVNSLSESFIFIPINIDREQAIAKTFKVRAVPTFFFLDQKAEPASYLPGAMPADLFLNILSYISSASYKSVEFDDYLSALEKKTP